MEAAKILSSFLKILALFLLCLSANVCCHPSYRGEGNALDVTGCSKHPSFDNNGEGAGHLYRGAYFCDILYQFTSGDQGLLAVIPNWNCNSSDEFCSRLGPFETNRRATAFAHSAVAVQGLKCVPADGPDSTAMARVSAIFRFVPPWEHQPTVAGQTGLSGMALSAEGAWSASTGRLCMVACRGIGTEAACNYTVTLYVSTVFSIARRGIIVGQITATDGSHPPLSFQQQGSPAQPWHQLGESLRMAYDYTKVEQAGELLRVSGPSGFRRTFIAMSFLSYPKIASGAADDMAGLSILADDLGLRLRKPHFVPEWMEEPFFQLQILSIGALVGRYYPPFLGAPNMPVEEIGSGHGTEKQQKLLNVSAEFTASRLFPGSSPAMSLEGVYSPEDGRMYLIGCRSVHAARQVLSTSRDLEDGMDCSIEVTVEYPPTTMRWLVSPVAKVRIASTRDADDPLHFDRTEHHSLPVIYRDQRGVLAEEALEGILCIAMLSGTVAATLGQLRYIRSHADVAPYISLAMLGVQALGYGATLAAVAKTLPAWPTSSYRTYACHLRWNVDSTVKAFTLAALLLTARLAQKVWRSRARAPLEPSRVPSESVVLLCSLFFVLAVNWMSQYGASTDLQPGVLYFEAQGTSSSHMRMRSAVVDQYVGAVKEWFLLPQVIGNAVWRVNCRPLAARYYVGVTTVWLLPHVYAYLRPPVVYDRVSVYPEAHDCATSFYSKTGAVVVPVVGIVLAVAVYVQQRWNYKIVGWTVRAEQNKLQHVY